MHIHSILKMFKTIFLILNPLNANPKKWLNTLKQIVGNLPTICLSVFDHFMNLALKGLTYDLVQIFITFNKTDVSLFKQVNE